MLRTAGSPTCVLLMLLFCIASICFFFWPMALIPLIDFCTGNPFQYLLLVSTSVGNYTASKRYCLRPKHGQLTLLPLFLFPHVLYVSGTVPVPTLYQRCHHQCMCYSHLTPIIPPRLGHVCLHFDWHSTPRRPSFTLYSSLTLNSSRCFPQDDCSSNGGNSGQAGVWNCSLAMTLLDVRHT